ncbi:multiple sugar transport system permease protein [Kaistia hirudinis]|uniref:Maltose/maltodextrin transport system permease protein MalG n=1 Tax=Kaistia hirudinis TaxID=1293440 RepID=A0A840APV8_9HYPH|nr:carbohydrate ABC transporter permease [Kaistia hirudinis]MBB3931424.1 multiple sugar transport system permease protein [Kaistia hirudinis]MBN9016058.1 carbohydrate ABC transporter permease [Hyphomicrobiales bacterium]
MSRRAAFWLVLAVVVAVIWTFLPMYWTVKYAFMTKTEIARFPPMLYPHAPNLASFFNIFGFDYTADNGTVYKASGQARQIILGIRNSVLVAVIVTAVTTLVVVPLAYVFARLEFPFKGKLLAAILLSVSLPPVSTLIPFYTLYVQLGLTGTLIGLIIVTLTITIPIVAWMLIGFFRNLPPVELLARVDGFSRFYVLTRIIVPMARSGILVAAVIAFLFSWNEYVYAQILVTGSNAVTLPAAMSGFLFQVPEPSQLAASLLLSLLPPFVIAFFLQKHIAEMHLA